MPKSANRKKTVLFKFFLVNFLFFTACAAGTPKHQGTSKAFIGDDFILIKTTDEDTLSSLAADHLNDPKKGWLIAEFNNIKTVPNKLVSHFFCHSRFSATIENLNFYFLWNIISFCIR